MSKKSFSLAPSRALVRPTQLAAGIALALTLWPLAQAQDKPAEKAEKSQLETVVITAERRAENIKDVPIAVSTLKGEKLDVLASGGQDVRFLSGRVPSLNIESSFGRAYPRFYIRGYGNTDFRLNASQPVSVLFDDVVQENPILKGFPVFDQRNVEVLAGPQGTLFGRNTPAGVVKFDSVRPSKKQDAYVSASYGSYGSYSLEGAANLPLAGDWSARISAQTQHRDDWVKNTNPKGPTQETEGYRDSAVRVQALYEPSKTFSALFNLHHRDLDGSPRLFRASIIKPGTSDLIDGFDPAKVSLDGLNKQTLTQTGGSMKLKWALPEFTVHSITGYETVKPFSRGDIDGGSVYKFPQGPGEAGFPVETSDALDGHRQLSQEVRLESNASGPLRWQAGVYLFDERYTAVAQDYIGPLTTSTRQTNKAWATFGSINYDLSADFKLRAGLRYTKDKKELSTSTTDPKRIQAGNGLSLNTDDAKWNWDASATYALNKDTNVYARVATGFRASSIQPAAEFNPQSFAGPEDVISYELGLKSDLWDRRARLSAALFNYEVKNQQFTAVGGGNNANRLINAKKVGGQGLEFNLELLPIDNLLLTVGGSYNDTKIKDGGLQVEACGASCTLRDPIIVPKNPAIFKFSDTVAIDGNSLAQAPKWIGNLTARYTIPTPAGNEFYVYTDWAYRSSVSFFLYDSVEFTGKPLTEGGLRLGYIWNNGKYEVAAYGRNITNQIRVTGAIDFNNLTGFINDPRTYGVQFKAIF
ncbi:TonB-dependent receptor [Paucibacter sp. AS339]|uniref:TonB-dependent receptor n=1 Tax=Paucibacter hankyongi TaxID=3133434 RepID=UPI0030AB3B1B